MTDNLPIVLDKNPGTGVALLTLNRPRKLNAFNREMIALWIEALHDVKADSGVKALVVTGAGKAFCAGGDIDELEELVGMTTTERKDFLWREVNEIAFLLERIDIPVIAAINGTARGAGLDMALMCDLRVMDEKAIVAESYIFMGVMPGDGGTWFLPRLVGTAMALELIWTGDDIDAETAFRCGMINRIAPNGQTLIKAMDLAERIACQPSEAVKYTKRAVYDGMTTSLRSHLDAASSHMAVLQGTQDFRNRVTLFLERARRKN